MTDNNTTRAEHLQWCKDRALAYIDAGDVQNAFMSFASDVTKHPGTVGIRDTISFLGMPLLMAGLLNTPEKMREHILGYN